MLCRPTFISDLAVCPVLYHLYVICSLDILLTADWLFIQQGREQVVNEYLCYQNKKRQSFDHEKGQQVLKRVHLPTKVGPHTKGPYCIEQVHPNGILTIWLRPGVFERINIRRLKPYQEPT